MTEVQEHNQVSQLYLLWYLAGSDAEAQTTELHKDGTIHTHSYGQDYLESDNGYGKAPNLDFRPHRLDANFGKASYLDVNFSPLHLDANMGPPHLDVNFGKAPYREQVPLDRPPENDMGTPSDLLMLKHQDRESASDAANTSEHLHEPHVHEGEQRRTSSPSCIAVQHRRPASPSCIAVPHRRPASLSCITVLHRHQHRQLVRPQVQGLLRHRRPLQRH